MCDTSELLEQLDERELVVEVSLEPGTGEGDSFDQERFGGLASCCSGCWLAVAADEIDEDDE